MKEILRIPVSNGSDGATEAIQWFPDSKHLIATQSGRQRLWLLDGTNGNVKEYYTGGHNKGYLNMAVSPDCKSIALERIDRTRISDQVVHQETYISIMDIDGKNERRLN